ncbi:SDR family oxidoreductase [Sphingobium sp. Sx8-8]|uniref:SDR family NAD(P)-dependent oxidoreductase n=1 Tax=Sphingobium sp. Sx8-8 TaxID=2933617 RepID=UPI001F562F82
MAVVTGGGSGIGLATARLLATEGATVIVADIRREAAEMAVADIAASGGRAHACVGDIADRDLVQEGARDIVARFGKIDLLVNNAGLPVPGSPETYKELGRSLDVNVCGAFHWSQAAAVESMIPNRSGAIVMVSSLAGLVALPGDIGYVIAKHGLLGMTKALAIEWAEYGIRVNCVAPGTTSSLMVQEAMRDYPTFMAERIGRIPIGRIAEPEDQAKAILFLASDDAAYITGVTLPVDGGQMALHSGFTKGR